MSMIKFLLKMNYFHTILGPFKYVYPTFGSIWYPKKNKISKVKKYNINLERRKAQLLFLWYQGNPTPARKKERNILYKKYTYNIK